MPTPPHMSSPKHAPFACLYTCAHIPVHSYMPTHIHVYMYLSNTQCTHACTHIVCAHTHTFLSYSVRMQLKAHGQSFCFLRFHRENLGGPFLNTPTAGVWTHQPLVHSVYFKSMYTQGRILPVFWVPHRSPLRSPAVTLRSSVRTHARTCSDISFIF